MYCQKLKNIVRHIDSPKYSITLEVASKFDTYLRDRITIAARERINPLHFSVTMGVNDTTSLMFFVIGAKIGLFATRAYFGCKCGSQMEINGLKNEIFCDFCDEYIVPGESREKVFLFFRLIDALEECNMYEESERYQVDFIEDDALGKNQASLVVFDNIIGESETSNLLNDRRERTYDNYLSE